MHLLHINNACWIAFSFVLWLLLLSSNAENLVYISYENVGNIIFTKEDSNLFNIFTCKLVPATLKLLLLWITSNAKILLLSFLFFLTGVNPDGRGIYDEFCLLLEIPAISSILNRFNKYY